MEIQNTWSKEGINIHFESFVILWLTCTDVQMQFYCRVFVYESHILPKAWFLHGSNILKMMRIIIMIMIIIKMIIIIMMIIILIITIITMMLKICSKI